MRSPLWRESSRWDIYLIRKFYMVSNTPLLIILVDCGANPRKSTHCRYLKIMWVWHLWRWSCFVKTSCKAVSHRSSYHPSWTSHIWQCLTGWEWRSHDRWAPKPPNPTRLWTVGFSCSLRRQTCICAYHWKLQMEEVDLEDSIEHPSLFFLSRGKMNTIFEEFLMHSETNLWVSSSGFNG